MYLSIVPAWKKETGVDRSESNYVDPKMRIWQFLYRTTVILHIRPLLSEVTAHIMQPF